MFDRAILHLDLDAFFASVECLKNSALQNKPLLIGGSSDRGVVSSCSYAARKFGVRAAMPMKMALRLCPDAIVLKGDMDEYTRQSQLITDIIKEEAPLFEKASIDEFYIDLTGMDRYFGSWQWSMAFKQKLIKESGLPLSIALSINKLVSKVGVGVKKPNAEAVIISGTEKDFMAPLSVRCIPSVGKETQKKLSFMGIRTVHTLAQVPLPLLHREFGKQGQTLWRSANAIDDSPVVPYSEKKSISTERTFQLDTIDVRWLKDKLSALVTQLAFELRQSHKLTSCLTIKIRYTDFNTYTKQSRVSYTTHDKTLIRRAHELFDQLYQRRQLVRLIGVKFSGLVSGHYQVDLFEDTINEVNLMQAMDKIRNRFGKNAIGQATTLPLIKNKGE